MESEGAAWSPSLDELATAVNRRYRAVPDPLRRDVEFAVRREQRALARVRSTISMDR